MLNHGQQSKAAAPGKNQKAKPWQEPKSARRQVPTGAQGIPVRRARQDTGDGRSLDELFDMLLTGHVKPERTNFLRWEGGRRPRSKRRTGPGVAQGQAHGTPSQA